MSGVEHIGDRRRERRAKKPQPDLERELARLVLLAGPADALGGARHTRRVELQAVGVGGQANAVGHRQAGLAEPGERPGLPSHPLGVDCLGVVERDREPPPLTHPGQ